MHAQFHAKTALNLSWITSKLVAKQLQPLRGILYGVEFPYLTPMFPQWVLWVLQTPSEMEWRWVQSKNGSMLRNVASLPVPSSCSGVLASFVWIRMAKGLVELPESRLLLHDSIVSERGLDSFQGLTVYIMTYGTLTCYLRDLLSDETCRFEFSAASGILTS